MMNKVNQATNNMMLFPPMPELDSIKYFKQALQVSVHHFYMVDEIDEVGPYLEMINILKTAEQHDTIFIYLNTPGGNLYTAIQIISAMRQSNATVVTCIEGMVASAGTLIFLAGHKHVVNPNCTFMIHNYSHIARGKGNEVAIQVKHSEDYFAKLCRDFYSNFLTDEEIETVVNGKDYWMESEEVLARLGAENSASSVNALMEAITGGNVPTDAEEECDGEVLQTLIDAMQQQISDEPEQPATKTKRKSKKKDS